MGRKSLILAGIYEIERPIGEGGVGTAYLGWHLRLNKRVVLKADRRTLSTKPEVLRREVDMLKGLSHTYIPQVYDFVEQDGIVYTVMDYIEGESLDKPLRRGERFSQPQIIRWACELLEALCYLHSRPPYGILHGDIKPANIMVRPNGDICLIDFNIALALGENGAVKAGSSRGYASPEQYDYEKYDYENKRAETTQTAMSGDAAETVLMEPGQKSVKEYSSSTSSTVRLLDARSDIYSLGATLYHLLSGQRPPSDAKKVIALGKDVCSSQVSEIIRKAMDPDPELRFQSAENMLDAFLQLHRQDARMVRHIRRSRATVAVLALGFLVSGACALLGARQMEQMQQSLTLAEYSSNALDKGNVDQALELALQAVSQSGIFAPPVMPQAQSALTEALGVYDLSDGFKSLRTVELPAAPFRIILSPNGTKLAVTYAYELAVFDTQTGEQLEKLPMKQSAFAGVAFVDEEHIAYAGENGIAVYNLSNKKELWRGEDTTFLTVSGDGTRVAGVDQSQEKATVYQSFTGEKTATYPFQGRRISVIQNDIFADPMNYILTLNKEGSILAVSFSDGSVSLFGEEEKQIYAASDYQHFEGNFGDKWFALAAYGNEGSVFGMVDTEKYIYREGYRSENVLHLKTSLDKIYLSETNLLVELEPSSGEEREKAYTDGADITGFSVGDVYTLVTTDDQYFAFYGDGAERQSRWKGDENWDFAVLAGKYAALANRNEPSVRMMELESHEAELFLKYDSSISHEEARISGDGRTAMLFDYENFAIYDREGKLVTQKELPDAQQIYDQQFRREQEDSWLEVTWYDGTVRCYSSGDGMLLLEEKKDPPREDLYEEFVTDQYKIISDLHGVPAAYDLESGQLVKKLEQDSYLTYVTQLDNYIVTEYISADGERYGLLLNENLETLAVLPDLCDVSDGMLLFDDGIGNLRQSRLYSLQELTALGETIKLSQERREN